MQLYKHDTRVMSVHQLFFPFHFVFVRKFQLIHFRLADVKGYALCNLIRRRKIAVESLIGMLEQISNRNVQNKTKQKNEYVC